MTTNFEFGVGPIYEDRVVAFLDILGFSSLVKKSANNLEKQQGLYNFLKKYSKSSHANEGFSGFRNGDGSCCDDKDIEKLKAIYDYRFTQFSDSFVFSVKTAQRASVQYFPILISQLMQHALDLGFLVRGGITKGLMVHEEDGPAFGPAFIQAYQIESHLAFFGRVVLSKDAYDCINSSGTYSAGCIDKGLDDEYEITIASFMKEKYSSPLAKGKRAPALNEAIQKLTQMLDELESSERDCVANKYQYVISRLRSAVEEAER